MPFIQGTKPALIIPQRHILIAVDALHGVGYTRHRGLRWTRENELYTLKKTYNANGESMQNHVQVVAGPAELYVYAHTEPSGYGLNHMISAVMDKADFDSGAAMLRNDLKAAGYKR